MFKINPILKNKFYYIKNIAQNLLDDRLIVFSKEYRNAIKSGKFVAINPIKFLDTYYKSSHNEDGDELFDQSTNFFDRILTCLEPMFVYNNFKYVMRNNNKVDVDNDIEMLKSSIKLQHLIKRAVNVYKTTNNEFERKINNGCTTKKQQDDISLYIDSIEAQDKALKEAYENSKEERNLLDKSKKSYLLEKAKVGKMDYVDWSNDLLYNEIKKAKHGTYYLNESNNTNDIPVRVC